MATFHDKEFGDITIRRSHLSTGIKLSLAPNGSLRVSMPPHTPEFLAKRLVASSRSNIRELLEKKPADIYKDGMSIGKSHHLSISTGSSLSVTRHGQLITVLLPHSMSTEQTEVQAAIRAVVIQSLKKEAKSYLPRRLAFLANQFNFEYASVRFSHASSRWGSCSSHGVISLNIALMKLPFEVIDYVLLHELAHTRHMNHSDTFWETVAATCTDFKSLRAALKQQEPSI